MFIYSFLGRLLSENQIGAAPSRVKPGHACRTAPADSPRRTRRPAALPAPQEPQSGLEPKPPCLPVKALSSTRGGGAVGRQRPPRGSPHLHNHQPEFFRSRSTPPQPRLSPPRAPRTPARGPKTCWSARFVPAESPAAPPAPAPRPKRRRPQPKPAAEGRPATSTAPGEPREAPAGPSQADGPHTRRRRQLALLLSPARVAAPSSAQSSSSSNRHSPRRSAILPPLSSHHCLLRTPDQFHLIPELGGGGGRGRRAELSQATSPTTPNAAEGLWGCP